MVCKFSKITFVGASCIFNKKSLEHILIILFVKNYEIIDLIKSFNQFIECGIELKEISINSFH